MCWLSSLVKYAQRFINLDGCKYGVQICSKYMILHYYRIHFSLIDLILANYCRFLFSRYQRENINIGSNVLAIIAWLKSEMGTAQAQFLIYI